MSRKLDNLYRLQKKDVPQAAIVLTDAFQHDPIRQVVLSDATPTQRVATFETPLLYDQHALEPVLVSLMAFRIQQLVWRREPPGPYDHTWWPDQGRLEPACAFYFPPHNRRVRVALARLVSTLVYRFVV